MTRRARASAELQELYLDRFGGLLRRAAPETIGKRCLGAGIYWLLAGERQRARQRLKQALLTRHAPAAAAAGLLSLLPVEATAGALAIYRRAQRVAASVAATLSYFSGWLLGAAPRRTAGTS
jgi:hypothetical protein